LVERPDIKTDLIIGIDSGTSVVKAVAFTLKGTQVAACAVKNTYTAGVDGSATQSLSRTWDDCITALVGLAEHVENLADRTAAVAVTGQGDGTWLIDEHGKPVTDAWLWLDARAVDIVEDLVTSPFERQRFELTGTGLNTCQQGPQLAFMAQHHPEMLAHATTAFHCKDWLYFNLTGIRATDPSEASFTFGNFRTRQYSDTVIDALGLLDHRHLLPTIIDGSKTTHALTVEVAAKVGLHAGTPICLGFVDMIMTGLGAGIYTAEPGIACSTIGSTGVHMTAKRAADVTLNRHNTGYIICLPHEDFVGQAQTNMAATLNIDWILDVAADLVAEFSARPSHSDLLARLDGWLKDTQPGALIYHPYISEAGERGPFVDPNARASFVGVRINHRFADLARAVVESLGLAARDCYAVMGIVPKELRITGGGARSAALRKILSAIINAPVRVSSRDEAGAAGCAMMAAVAIGTFENMDACIAEWVVPLLGDPELPHRDLNKSYNDLFETYHTSRGAMTATWADLAKLRKPDANS
jgi:erythritol kinase